MKQEDIRKIIKSYDFGNLTIGVLGGHSALDICAGAKKYGFRTLAVCRKGREKTYEKYYRTRKSRGGKTGGKTIGCVDEVIVLPEFADILKPEVQEKLRKRNTIFIHNRYFWVYFDFSKIEKDFHVPIFGSRALLKLEERDQPKNQYYLLKKAGIRLPKMYKKPQDIDRLTVVKVNEAARGYERAFFTAASFEEYKKKSADMLKRKIINEKDLQKASIEEYIVGAQVNFNYFYSPITKELELSGTDMRRQTNLDGLLRLPAWTQEEIKNSFRVKMVETGHVAVTIKESLLGKAFDLGEKFVAVTQKENPPGIIGPFALQGAIVAEEGKEDIVIFDVSMRIPGSPGTRATPYSGYLYGDSISVGERIAIEIAAAKKLGKLEYLLT